MSTVLAMVTAGKKRSVLVQIRQKSARYP